MIKIYLENYHIFWSTYYTFDRDIYLPLIEDEDSLQYVVELNSQEMFLVKNAHSVYFLVCNDFYGDYEYTKEKYKACKDSPYIRSFLVEEKSHLVLFKDEKEELEFKLRYL